MIKFGLIVGGVALVSFVGYRFEPGSTAALRTISACYPADNYSAAMVGGLRRMAIASSGTDSAYREFVQLPKVTDTTLIYQVSDSATCANAVAVHNQHAGYTPAQLAMPEAQRVYLVRYNYLWVASNPKVHEDADHVAVYVMDSTFQYVKSFMR